MKVCAACGVENPDIARFCLACGTQLADARAPQETRKVVTIVFSDLKGSTSLGEALDSEALREVMTRYFDAMSHELERHGGVIEKFIGDAVMAVFGLPRLHEDDALRAVRAAAGMQAALEELNGELQRVYGVQLANRTGVNTGEVVAGDPASGQRLVTGDAVNVAARLEQAAGEREVLLGELTYRLVRDGVDVEEVEPLTLKGKSEPVPAYRLVGLRDASETETRSGTPLVGRDDELRALGDALDEVAATRSARLVSIVGDAGVGKSRLTAEFLEVAAGRAHALEGRCLPYGEGITFWPVAEAVRSLAGVVNDDDAAGARGKLAALAGAAGDGVTERLASAIGLTDDPFPVEELFWAVRRLLEHLSADRPVVFVVQDVHWAEVTFLELLDHLLQSIDEAPVLIVCPTRPELLEASPDWGSGARATRIVLDPLDAEASKTMIEALLGGGSLDAAVLERVVGAAEGNPLYAEQLLRMLTDEGVLEQRDGDWHAIGDLSEIHVPPTIQALLASRLDALGGDERSVIEPASVVGYVFPEAAVTALTPPDISPRVRTELSSLAHKHLVSPVEDGDEGAHRFQHIMIRDTAYDGILKRARADLHERFVGWADGVNRDRGVEFEEILGYHLEQAWKYLSELGPLDEHGRAIGEDGARRLASAGRRAFDRGDVPAAVTLLGRAAALLPEDHPERIRLLPEHGEALLMTGRFEEAERCSRRRSPERRSLPPRPPARPLVRLLVRLRTGDAEGWQRGRRSSERSRRRSRCSRRKGDEAGLAMAWRLLAWSAGTACRFGGRGRRRRARPSSTRSAPATCARSAVPRPRMQAPRLLGPTNVDEAITAARRRSSRRPATGSRKGTSSRSSAVSTRCRARSTTPGPRHSRPRHCFEELGLERRRRPASTSRRGGWRCSRARRIGRTCHSAMRTTRSTRSARSTSSRRLPGCSRRRSSSERRWTRPRRSASAAASSRPTADVETQALWRCVRGRMLARRRRLRPRPRRSSARRSTLLEPTDAT